MPAAETPPPALNPHGGFARIGQRVPREPVKGFRENPSKRLPWSVEEDHRLRDSYGQSGWLARATQEFPGRTLDAIRRRAWLLRQGSPALWTPAEDRCLTLLWQILPLPSLVRILQRSPAALVHRAHALSLPFQLPQDWVTVAQAARALSIPRSTLRLRIAQLPNPAILPRRALQRSRSTRPWTLLYLPLLQALLGQPMSPSG